MDNKLKYSNFIKAEAYRLGFFACGISKAGFLEDESDRYETWVKKGMHATMSYMEKNIDKRLDPTKLVSGAKSVISVLMNYYPEQIQSDKEAPIVSKYAYGEDYHFVIKDKIKTLFEKIKLEVGNITGRVFTDSAPILEKKWAELSGIAWRGKHSGMLTKQGSFFFIGELIIDLELIYDRSMKSYCGTCTRCIDACPTKAIIEPYIIDSRRCISYYTIEHKASIPEEMKGRFENQVFGCDICQDICPYNKKQLFHSEERFNPHPNMLGMSKEEWNDITEKRFNELFGKTALKRTGFSGLKRNLYFLKS